MLEILFRKTNYVVTVLVLLREFLKIGYRYFAGSFIRERLVNKFLEPKVQFSKTRPANKSDLGKLVFCG